jgi:hypothetical protein
VPEANDGAVGRAKGDIVESDRSSGYGVAKVTNISIFNIHRPATQSGRLSSRRGHVIGVKGGGMSNRAGESSQTEERVAGSERTIDQARGLVTQIALLKERVRSEKRYRTPVWSGAVRPGRREDQLGSLDHVGLRGGAIGEAGLKCWALDWDLIERRSRES